MLCVVRLICYSSDMEWRCPGPCGPLVGGVALVALGRGEQERGWRAVHPIKMQCRCTPCPIVHLHPVQCWSAARAQPCVLTCTLNMYTCRCALWWEGNVVILHSIRNSPVRREGSQPGSECNNTDPESRVHLTKEKKDFLCDETYSFPACELWKLFSQIYFPK